MRITILFLLSLVLAGCASLEKSVGLGAGIGAATGLGAGYAAKFNLKGKVVTTVSGALIGGFIGYLLQGRKFSEEALRSPSAGPPSPLDRPSLKDAETDTIWVPHKIEGQKLIEGHRLFIIKSQPTWQLPEEEESNGRKNKNK